MEFHGTKVLVTGEPGPLRQGLALHLCGLGARLVAGAAEPGDGVRYLFHVWSPANPETLARPALGWYDAAVAAPVRAAAILASGLLHLCLVRTEDSSVPVRVLDEALRFLCRQHGIPFAILRAPGDGQPGRAPAVAAFMAIYGLAGRVVIEPAALP